MTAWTPVGPPRLLSGSDLKKYLAKVDKESAKAPATAAASNAWTPTGPASPIQFTPEQRYENAVKGLPRAVQMVAPGTLGEAGMGVGTAFGWGAGLLGAPATGGLSLGLPLAGAVIGGALEDPKHVLRNAGWETAKGVLAEATGGLLTKGSELTGRFLFKSSMLQKTADRIGAALPKLFSGYPLPVPNTAKDLEDQIPSGKLSDAFGKRLGQLRDKLRGTISAYQPSIKPQLLPASSGQPYRYTAGKLASGTKFHLPDVVGDKVEWKDMSIGEAIDHVRSLQAAGWSTSGAAKSAKQAWLERQTAHDARDMLISQINAVQPGMGHLYGEMSGDYGASLHLEKIFRQSYRSDGELDQPALMRGLRNEIDDINKFKDFRRGTEFRTAVAPERAMAEEETHLLGHVHGGIGDIRWRNVIPKPFKPETRKMLPQPFRALSSKRALPIVGLAAEKGAEDVLEE